MDRDANYVAVGAFVIVVLAMATVFVLWYTKTQERREYQRYEVYFSGSVSGLNEGSTVRYLGVNVGRVARIRLDPRAADRVVALIDVDKATPVTHDTLARLAMQGVTGLLFIDLSQSAQNAVVSPEVPSQQYPVIRSVPSDFDLFVSGLPELVADATRVTRRLNEVLGDDTQSGLRAAVANVRAATEPLPQAIRDAARLVVELRAAVAEANAVATSANRLVQQAGPELQTATARLREASEHLASLSGRIDALIARHEPDLDRFASEGLNELPAILRESRDAAAEVRELARSLREDPSRLLYQRPTPGVEIPR
ncbi:MAG TPA: MlaD family protein [Steroidobacteraceae bacterium]|nr:MlaD family protein [Steroidobacteraceae bacterium]